ncbi:EcsC family protein [Streptomyces bambusae]|uniref:EcsC family protein n=1 Tax=Streptomyces bambusae TaxID=1550616 RepID=UPI001CFCDB8A|nr:EcsC family protein [Streptomyces bambusae]MCB5163678.1 EcsC family protein [Streptomyces bambusae]
MAGSTPFRKRPFRRELGSAEAHEGGTGPETGLEALSVPSAEPAGSGAGDSGDRPSEPRLKSGARRLYRSAKADKAVDAVVHGVRKGGEGARAGLAHLADLVIEVAPRIPVRDLATLRAQFPGLGPDQLAAKLIAGAANSSSTVGAGIGAAAMLPVPPAMPAELAAEITGVAAVELKLIAELHEVYGLRPPGTLKERSMAYLTAWTEERGIDVTRPASVNAALGGRMKRELRQQIMKRMVRTLPNLMPFMVGAAVGALMNRRDTKRLALKVQADLRYRAVPWDVLGELPPLDRHPDPLPGPGRPRPALEGPADRTG